MSAIFPAVIPVLKQYLKQSRSSGNICYNLSFTSIDSISQVKPNRNFIAMITVLPLILLRFAYIYPVCVNRKKRGQLAEFSLKNISLMNAGILCLCIIKAFFKKSFNELFYSISNEPFSWHKVKLQILFALSFIYLLCQSFLIVLELSQLSAKKVSF